MSLIPRNSLFDLDSFFEPSFTNAMWPSTRQLGNDLASFSPRVDVTEKENTYEISAELPGVKKEDISLDLQNGVLSLKAETKQEHKEEKDGKIVRQERRYGTYYRSFDLGKEVQQSDIQAEFNDGLLRVTAPKAPRESLETRRIAIE